MATHVLDVSSVIEASGWTGATVANLSASGDARATDGVAGELIRGALTDAPVDFDTLNSVTLHIEARRQGTVSRDKTVLVELLDSGDNALESFSTGVLGASDVQYDSSAFTRADNLTTVNGYRYRATVQEGGGMPGSATVEIDRIWATIDYNVAAATFNGDGAITIPMQTVSGAGTNTQPITATGAYTTPALLASGSATNTQPRTATGAYALPMASVAGAGTNIDPVTGDGAVSMPMQAWAGAGTLSVADNDRTASGAITLPMASVAGAGVNVDPVTADGALTVPMQAWAGGSQPVVAGRRGRRGRIGIDLGM